MVRLLRDHRYQDPEREIHGIDTNTLSSYRSHTLYQYKQDSSFEEYTPRCMLTSCDILLPYRLMYTIHLTRNPPQHRQPSTGFSEKMKAFSAYLNIARLHDGRSDYRAGNSRPTSSELASNSDFSFRRSCATSRLLQSESSFIE